jgi:hypothetical protein
VHKYVWLDKRVLEWDMQYARDPVLSRKKIQKDQSIIALEKDKRRDNGHHTDRTVEKLSVSLRPGINP